MLRQSPLKRSGPIKRKPRRAQRSPEDQAYMDWGHAQPCIVDEFSGTHVCEGGIEALHMDEGKGVGLKTPDSLCIFACFGAARDYDNNVGVFEGSRTLRRMTMRTLSKIQRDRYQGRSIMKLVTYDAPNGAPF